MSVAHLLRRSSFRKDKECQSKQCARPLDTGLLVSNICAMRAHCIPSNAQEEALLFILEFELTVPGLYACLCFSQKQQLLSRCDSCWLFSFIHYVRGPLQRGLSSHLHVSLTFFSLCYIPSVTCPFPSSRLPL